MSKILTPPEENSASIEISTYFLYIKSMSKLFFAILTIFSFVSVFSDTSVDETSFRIEVNEALEKTLAEFSISHANFICPAGYSCWFKQNRISSVFTEKQGSFSGTTIAGDIGVSASKFGIQFLEFDVSSSEEVSVEVNYTLGFHAINKFDPSRPRREEETFNKNTFFTCFINFKEAQIKSLRYSASAFALILGEAEQQTDRNNIHIDHNLIKSPTYSLNTAAAKLLQREGLLTNYKYAIQTVCNQYFKDVSSRGDLLNLALDKLMRARASIR